QGVPKYETLGEEFKVVAKDLRRAVIPSDLPWYSKFVHRLRSLVIVRKDGAPLLGGSETDEVLAEVKEQLAEGDLGAVLVLCVQLPKLDLESYQNWRQAIEVRQFVDMNLSVLESSALKYLLDKRL